jgi:outer membrane protein assembly factor BamB
MSATNRNEFNLLAGPAPVTPGSRPKTSPRKSFFRVWFPLVLIGLGVLAGVGAQLWPNEDWVPAYRNVAGWFIGFVTLLGLACWLVFLSGLRWYQSLGGLALLVVLLTGTSMACVRKVELTGDIAVIFHFRWEETAKEKLDRFLAGQKEGPPPAAVQASAGGETDFPAYRGRNRDGVVPSPLLARDWNVQPPRQVWPSHAVGGGYAAFAVAGNAAVTIEQREDEDGNPEEVIACYDTATGKQRWTYAYRALFEEFMGGPGPRATPTIDGDDVFSLGATGQLVCLELRSGKYKWSVNVLKDNDNLKWGMSGSPLVYDEVVVVNPGAQRPSARGRAVVAYHRVTGKEVWRAGEARAAYASPMLATLAGEHQVLIFDAEGLAGYDAKKGKELWRYPWVTQEGINVAQPIVLEGDRVFISSGYGVGGAMLQVSQSEGKWSVRALWTSLKMACKFSSPVAYQGYLYGLSEGTLVCLDQETGEPQWRGERYAHGQLLRSGGLLLVLGEKGQLALVEATPDGYRQLGYLPRALKGKTWNNPALANGRAYLRNHSEMACYELPVQK